MLAQSDKLRRRDDTEGQLKLECGRKLDQGPREEAHAFCDQLYDPNDAEKLTMLGTIYGQHGDQEAALKPLRRAAELAPRSPQMQYNLALNLYYLNRFDEARTPLADALKRWPDLFPLNALYGAVLVKLGEGLAARPALQRAHQLNPQDVPTVELLYATDLSLGASSQTAKQYQAAIQYLTEAAELRPEQPDPHRRLAELYRLLNRAADASREQVEAERLATALAPQGASP
jgi:tetratricopeptide (TPR) repeat protein